MRLQGPDQVLSLVHGLLERSVRGRLVADLDELHEGDELVGRERQGTRGAGRSRHRPGRAGAEQPHRASWYSRPRWSPWPSWNGLSVGGSRVRQVVPTA